MFSFEKKFFFFKKTYYYYIFPSQHFTIKWHTKFGWKGPLGSKSKI